jgi:hypothetical protein
MLLKKIALSTFSFSLPSYEVSQTHYGGTVIGINGYFPLNRPNIGVQPEIITNHQEYSSIGDKMIHILQDNLGTDVSFLQL